MKEFILNFILFVTILITSAIYASAVSCPAKESTTITKQFDKTRLLEYIIEEEKKNPDFYQNSWSSSYPPLKPERFRRRMKMLFAIDIKDYPENAWIRIIGNGFNYTIENGDYEGDYISLNDQRFYSLDKKVKLNDETSEERSPFDGMEDNIGEDYGTIILDYLLYNDLVALDSITTYKYRLCKESLGEKWEEDERAEDLLYAYNILYTVYSLIHTTPSELIYYVDKNKDVNDDSRYIRTDYQVGIFYRTSALRGDLQLLYILDEKKKNRHITCNSYDTVDDIAVSTDNLKVRSFRDPYNRLPWFENTPERSTAEYMSFLLQIREKELNTFLIQYISGQNETYSNKEKAVAVREQIRSNNYYGHTILREFCENPEREMPTLEKPGTSFSAKVLNPDALLYLEPYPDSYSIDTIQPAEIFKAYEIGYDEYYLVEVVKPVESPVTGADGYAMILDRTETVYGYIKKAEVKEVKEVGF